MAHQSKTKAKGLSSTSFFELKAELSKQQDSSVKSSLLSKPTKKPTIWARTNKGVQGRAQHDSELEAISKPTLEAAHAALERKSKIYDKLRKGKTGGLSEAQIDTLLVDFDWQDGSDESDEDESLTVPVAQDDPMVEYEDEFGRMRTARRSEVPRNLRQQGDEPPDPDEDLIIRNPENHFPTYEPNFERISEIEKAFSDANNPLASHYDASRENRAKGAGFYSFSGDEETRQAQMEELISSRKETETVRKEVGAVDIRPGEVEGMRAQGGSTKSKATEKRKRELEERKQLVEAKRRKMRGEPEPASHPSPPPLQRPNVSQQETSTSLDPFAAMERASLPAKDPFAAIEQSSRSRQDPQESPSDADLFLASLEHDLLQRKT